MVYGMTEIFNEVSGHYKNTMIVNNFEQIMLIIDSISHVSHQSKRKNVQLFIDVTSLILNNNNMESRNINLFSKKEGFENIQVPLLMLHLKLFTVTVDSRYVQTSNISI